MNAIIGKIDDWLLFFYPFPSSDHFLIPLISSNVENIQLFIAYKNFLIFISFSLFQSFSLRHERDFLKLSAVVKIASLDTS